MTNTQSSEQTHSDSLELPAAISGLFGTFTILRGQRTATTTSYSLTLRSGAVVAMAAAVAAAMVVAESTSLGADLVSPPTLSLFSVKAFPKSCTFTSL